jgi:hypothetical protein
VFQASEPGQDFYPARNGSASLPRAPPGNTALSLPIHTFPAVIGSPAGSLSVFYKKMPFRHLTRRRPFDIFTSNTSNMHI